MRKTSRWLCILCVALIGATVQGQTLFTATLDAEQEVQEPPVVSPAYGTGSVLLSAAEDMIWVSLDFTGLIGDQTAAHLHGPATFGVNAGVQIHLPVGTFQDVELAITPQQVQWLKDELLYFNVHTTVYPAGEIRGQVIPEPASLMLLAAGGLLLARKRQT